MMKKRIISMLLVFCMIVTMVPGQIFASDPKAPEQPKQEATKQSVPMPPNQPPPCHLYFI